VVVDLRFISPCWHGDLTDLQRCCKRGSNNIFKEIWDHWQFRNTSIVICFHFLWREITNDSFHILGNCEGSKDKINNLRRDLHKASSPFLNTQPGKPSGPGEYTGLARWRSTSKELSFKVGQNIINKIK